MTTEIKPKKELKVLQCPSASAGGAGGVDEERRRPAEVCPAVRDQQHLAGAVATTSGQSPGWSRRCNRAVGRTTTGQALTTKLERLLARQALTAEGKLSKLERRLAKLPPEPTVTPPKEK